jgi:hypothetical protein
VTSDWDKVKGTGKWEINYLAPIYILHVALLDIPFLKM